MHILYMRGDALAPMCCQCCGAEFDHANILKLQLGDSVRLVCPDCKAPGPVFVQGEIGFRVTLKSD